jgi:hypothetical protein
MSQHITPIPVPSCSDIGKQLQGADFFDSYEMRIQHAGRSALEIYLGLIAKTPAWVTFLMATRNRVVLLLGLKNLGQLGDVAKTKNASAYRVGDRVGIFSLLSATDDEVILGDSDKHLDVKVSICKLGKGTQESVAVSTVVHIHNLLGRVYMFFVKPMHKLIAPAVLARARDVSSHA